MRRADLLCGVFIAALGVVSLVEALRVRDDWQGAKLMPAVLGVALLALGAGHFAPAPAAERPAWPDGARARRIAFVFGVLVVYVTALPVLGFLPATLGFVLVLLGALGDVSWALTLVMSGAIAIASHVVFKHWLGMPLPTGLFGL